jgi:hypothetical protein
MVSADVQRMYSINTAHVRLTTDTDVGACARSEIQYNRIMPYPHPRRGNSARLCTRMHVLSSLSVACGYGSVLLIRLSACAHIPVSMGQRRRWHDEDCLTMPMRVHVYGVHANFFRPCNGNPQRPDVFVRRQKQWL